MTDARLGVAAAYDGERLVAGDVAIADGRVAELGLQPPVGDLLAAPGFVDLQVNGYAGVDLQVASVGEVVRVGEALPEAGVTAYQRAMLADGRLAGSTATLDQCLRGLVAAGVPLENALATITSRPAALLGRPELGRLRAGGVADLVLDPTLHPMRTLVGGRTVYERATVEAGARG